MIYIEKVDRIRSISKHFQYNSTFSILSGHELIDFVATFQQNSKNLDKKNSIKSQLDHDLSQNFKQGQLDCMSLNGLDGKVEDSGLKGPGFNPQPRQGKLNNIFSCFGLVVLEPIRYTPKCLMHYTHWNIMQSNRRTNDMMLKNLRDLNCWGWSRLFLLNT